MAEKGCLLAEIPQFGRVFDCGECGKIHLTVGAFGVSLSPEAYFQLVTLLHTSAANFELWLAEKQARNESIADSRGIYADPESDANPA